ncbi:MFS transporter [Actinokineospora diospyrosa]|uniref:MFS transporter n=1 Tax=Actinokineospora diospyrosa TaxID=103728 RepID=UPI0020A603BF|nr:MFS transporter [Actinokineospora diospyrosa]
MLPFRRALAERDVRLLVAARLISQLGNQAAVTVTGLAVLDIGGGVAGIGVVLAAGALAMAAFLLVGGVLADHVPRRRAMVAADLVRFAAQGLTALLLLTGTAEVWHLALAQSVAGVAAGVYLPAVTAIGAEVSSAQHRKEANALRGLVNALSAVVGPAIGGLLVVAVGPGAALAVDAVTFLASAGLVAAMRSGSAASGGRPGLLVGWSEFRSRRWLWSVTVLAGACGLVVFAPITVLGPVVLGATWPAVLTAQGVGAFIGGVLVTWPRPRRPLVWVVFGALLLLPLPLLVAAAAPLPLVLAGAFVWGVEQSAHWTLWQTALQDGVPGDVLARVSSFDWLVFTAAGPLGYLLAPLGVAAIGAAGTLVVGSVLVSIVVLLVRAGLPRDPCAR